MEKFLKGDSDHAASELIKHFEMGGLRTIIRNLNALPDEKKIQYMHVLRHMDLFRFRNDLNANLTEAKDDTSKMVALRLLATFGDRLSPEVFEPHVANEENSVAVRLAACSGLIQAQRPSNYDRFIEIANKAIVDPTTGQDDFAFAEISHQNRGFFLYTKSKLEDKKAPTGAILISVYLAQNKNDDIYTNVLNLRRRKLVPYMIDRAVMAGAPALLDVMAEHRSAKKFRDQISRAKPAAQAVAKYRAKFFDQYEKDQAPIAARIPHKGTGSAAEGNYHAAYAVVEVSAEGDMKVVVHEKPFGSGGDNLQSVLSGKTLPAYVKWQPVASYYLVVAP
ncbi:hypothetical protein [Sulfidibacter corallicola]|uniref:Uncharacterized protein n=1 Tax=Sulfidibacter corallicola TaxID=2818388 RepID=A0A8A4TJZ4_SULCO|nr:hypothetical protein [Sulfidibacter corallicola]QTD49138.1 hypothetical protein J3U87_26430 [Sulfidibacter corallicola]